MTKLKAFADDKLNLLPNNRILDMTKLKAFADDKLNITGMMVSSFDRVENTVGKGENAGYQHFLLFPTVFSNAFFFRVLKSRDHMGKGKLSIKW